MIEAKDYTSLQLVQSQEILQDYNQSLETAQYSTPYSYPNESYHRLLQQPQDCTSLQTGG